MRGLPAGRGGRPTPVTRPPGGGALRSPSAGRGGRPTPVTRPPGGGGLRSSISKSAGDGRRVVVVLPTVAMRLTRRRAAPCGHGREEGRSGTRLSAVGRV